MARLIPGCFDPATPDGERSVLQDLLAALPADAVLYHHCRFARKRPGGRPPGEAELDALAVIPGRGCLVVEIKAGGVKAGPGGWESTDRHGATHAIRDPSEQAANAARWLKSFGLERNVWRQRSDVSPIEWAVAFPDIVVRGPLTPALPRERILDRDDLRDLGRAFDRLLPARATQGLDRLHLIRLERELVPELDLTVPLATLIESDERALVRLTEDQRRVLDGVLGNRRVAVRGGAGTGKTLLAREIARRFAAEGKRVLVLCYNRMLAELLARDLTGEAEPAGRENLTVTTFHGLSEELARAAGLPWEPPRGDAEPDFWRDTANELLFDALGRCPERRFDVIVVDEAQDFAETWWLTVEALLADPKQGRLWLFHDPAQTIFGGTVPEAALGCFVYDLPWNCRNTRRIAARAWELLGPEGAGDALPAPNLHPAAPEGEAPELITCRNESEMIRGVEKALHRLRNDAKIPAARILVLTPFNLDRSAVWKGRNRIAVPLARLEPGHPSIDRTTQPDAVPIASLARFKGLEADAVVLCEIRPDSHACTPRHLYIGASRARHLLVELTYASDS
ncbi:MAG TPA: AAA family ATPase [Thermoanaerobaculia bacterium]|nr:AAA family ATPase [Thermoanaerobaculia bacterium]HRR13976.1 AAA family ATPase [Thermoanaerobaculia bacterium]HRS36934.1 AAA family ATPase [Thermoanaerobaculia bacterium]HRU08304.1 AAA family ATPase [Thermoanaerobaculia bacterium]